MLETKDTDVEVCIPSSGMLETKDTDVEVLIWEYLRVRCSRVKRLAWGKVRESSIDEQTVQPIPLSHAKFAEWLMPFVEPRKETTEIMYY